MVCRRPKLYHRHSQTTFPLPLMSISNAAVKPWLHSFLDSAEEVFTTEIETSAATLDHNTFANRAIIRCRHVKVDAALEDGALKEAALEDAEKVTYH